MTHRTFLLSMLGLFLLLLIVQAASLAVGSVPIGFSEIVDYLFLRNEATDAGVNSVILWELRLPRILLAGVTGAGLAGAGAAYQALFRNPLADPFIIGASSGAALGAALAVTFGLGWSIGGFQPLPMAAFIGTFAAVVVVFFLGGLGAGASALTLLLAGTAINTILQAGVSFLMLRDEQGLRIIFSWLLGGFSGQSWPHLQTGGTYIAVGLISLFFLSRRLDALTLGEESARSLGLNVTATRLMVIAAASLTTAAAVSIAGIIGFVGLLAPHAARLIFGGRHARLIPASALIGALLLVVADNAARTVMIPVEIPVGILMSLIGGPFFLYLLTNRRHKLGERS